MAASVSNNADRHAAQSSVSTDATHTAKAKQRHTEDLLGEGLLTCQDLEIVFSLVKPFKAPQALRNNQPEGKSKAGQGFMSCPAPLDRPL